MRIKILLLAIASSLFSLAVHAQCSFTGLLTSTCSNAAVINLTGNGAPDGQFTGAGVTDNGNGTGSFNPATAGPGNHTVTYELVDYNVTSIAAAVTSGSGTSISLADNAVSSALNLGFNFKFYGKSYNQVYASSNGFITFDPAAPAGCCSGQNIPNTAAPNNLIAAAWEDLDPSGAGAPVISFFTTGTSPNRIFIVNYNNLPHGPASGTANFVTTQIKLFETSNIIEIHTTAMASDGGLHTMGVENINGTRAKAVTGRNAANWSIASPEAIQFTPVFCQDSSVISVAPAPTLAVIGPDTTICPGTPVHLNVDITSGTAPFTVNVNNGVGSVSNYTSGANITANPVTNTTYSLVSVTDINGCVCNALSDSAVVTIATPSSAAVLSGDTAICNGETANLSVNITGGTGPFTVVLDTSGASASNYNSGSNIPVSPSVTSLYTIASVSDVYGCPGSGNTGSALVTVNNGASAVTLGGDAQTCLGVDTYLWVTITGGTPPYAVTLSSGVGTVTNYQSGDSIQVNPFVSTTYNVVSVVDANGCSATSLGTAFTVNLNLAPTSAILSGTKTICAGDSTDLKVTIVGGTGPYTVEIDNGVGIIGNYASGTNISVSPATTTTYHLLSISDAIGCPAASISGAPVVTVGSIPALPVIIQNGNVLTSPPASTYQWFLNGSPISGATSQTYVVTTAGNYSVQVFDGNGCSNTSAGLFVQPVGVEEAFDGSFSVYPNPTNGNLNIALDLNTASQIQVRLTSLVGSELLRTQSNGQVTQFKHQLNLENYPAGIYLLDVRVGDRRLTQKVEKF